MNARRTWSMWAVRTKLGGQKADRLMYTTLSQYLAPNSDFVAGRKATLAAAKDLGMSRADQKVVAEAFDAAGIQDGWEKRLGMDSRVLLPAMDLWPEVRAAGNAWTMVRIDAAKDYQLQILAGDTSGRTQIVSTDDNAINEWPDTDGKSVVWRSIPQDRALPTQIMRYDLATGKRSVVHETHDNVVRVVVSGDRVVWSTADFEAKQFAVYQRLGNGPVTEVTKDRSRYVDQLSLRGDVLGLHLATEDNVISTAVHNLRTGAEKTLATATMTAGKSPFVSEPVVAGSRTFYSIDTDGDGRFSIVMVEDQGFGKETKLFNEKSELAPKLPMFDATDEALTYVESVTGDPFDQNKSPKLMQMSLGSDRHVVRFSCNRGQAGAFEMVGKTGVVWMDATLGTPQLVYLDRARPTCPIR